ncbi:MAG: hypothetical protein PVF98_16055, partial [Desulfobacterales bacterium]
CYMAVALTDTTYLRFKIPFKSHQILVLLVDGRPTDAGFPDDFFLKFPPHGICLTGFCNPSKKLNLIYKSDRWNEWMTTEE